MAHFERWVDIHEGYYEVSDLGNVRRAKPGISTFVGRPVMPIASAGGYVMVRLNGPFVRHAYAHHIVMEAFIGPRPTDRVVNHKDGNKQNNALSNLEYVTRKENSKHAHDNLPRRRGPKKEIREKTGMPTGDNHWSKRTPDKIARGSRMPHCKLTEDQVRASRARVSSGEKQIDVARDLNISVAQMSRIIRGVRWTYVK